VSKRALRWQEAFERFRQAACLFFPEDSAGRPAWKQATPSGRRDKPPAREEREAEKCAISSGRKVLIDCFNYSLQPDAQRNRRVKVRSQMAELRIAGFVASATLPLTSNLILSIPDRSFSQILQEILEFVGQRARELQGFLGARMSQL
jgi:hypothetical protein